MSPVVPDEILMAYADGELEPDDARALEALLARDGELRLRLEPFLVTREVSSVYEHRLHEPIPEAMIETIRRATAGLAGQRAKVPGREKPSAGLLLRSVIDRLFPHGLSFATAATAAILIAIGATGGWLAGSSADAPATAGLIVAAGPNLVASGALARALESAPSLPAPTSAAAGTITPVQSFHSVRQEVCREYRIAGGASAPDFAGLACRGEDSVWRVALHVETQKVAPSVAQEGDGGPHQTATGATVPAIDALVDTMIVGDVLGSEEEGTLLGRGWTSQAR